MPGWVVPMNMIADVVFVAQMKKLPVDWSQPSGEAGDMYNQSFETNELVSVPEPLCYFWPASLNKYHTDTCKEIGGNFKDFCHAALDATKSAIDQWRLQSKFKDLKVMSICAIGTPGCLDAPDLKDCYVGWEGSEDNEKAYIKAVKEGVSDCLKEWSSKAMVPGLPWWPAFAAYPLASAAPIPNVPTPLIACPSPGIAKMTPTMLRDAMIDKLDGGVKDNDSDKQHEALFMAIGTGICVAFMPWLAMQMCMNIMGKGPVPSYAPPYVPVGPVVAGDNLAVPGHHSA